MTDTTEPTVEQKIKLDAIDAVDTMAMASIRLAGALHEMAATLRHTVTEGAGSIPPITIACPECMLDAQRGGEEAPKDEEAPSTAETASEAPESPEMARKRDCVESLNAALGCGKTTIDLDKATGRTVEGWTIGPVEAPKAAAAGLARSVMDVAEELDARPVQAQKPAPVSDTAETPSAAPAASDAVSDAASSGHVFTTAALHR